MYLFIFDDQSVKQSSEIQEGDDQSVDSGYLDVIRFENGHFERWCPNQEPEWQKV